MSEEFANGGLHENEIQTGERITKSPLTGTFYRVTKWEDLGEGKMRALEKEEVDEDELPQEVLDAF